MTSPAELKTKLWNALASDRIMMLGLDGREGGHARPMTAQLEGDRGPLWFFTSRDNGLVQALTGEGRVTATFTGKGHELFASLQGHLREDNDRATVDRLWNRFVAAWYEGGKDDPKLVLLRLDAESAEIWENGSPFLTGVKMVLGMDVTRESQEHVAQVPLP